MHFISKLLTYVTFMRLHFLCDNSAVVEVINRRTAKDPCMLALLRHLMFISLRFDFHVYASHLPGRVNVVADHLSRFQVSQAFLASQGLRNSPAQVPQALRTALLL